MNQSVSILRTFRFQDISVGQRESFDYAITAVTYQHFLDTFQDHSPLHVDHEHAVARGYLGRVMHGSILNGFISHFVGMWFPGRYSLLLSVDLRFANPSYIEDRLRINAVVRQKMDLHHIVIFDVVIANLTRDHLAARGRVQVMIKEAESTKELA